MKSCLDKKNVNGVMERCRMTPNSENMDFEISKQIAKQPYLVITY